jgi:hypothetical protein
MGGKSKKILISKLKSKYKVIIKYIMRISLNTINNLFKLIDNL